MKPKDLDAAVDLALHTLVSIIGQDANHAEVKLQASIQILKYARGISTEDLMILIKTAMGGKS